MSDIEKAKELFAGGEFTCVLVKDDKIYSSNLSGIAPMVGFIKDGVDLSGFSAADKIVGKAAALLFVLAGVKEVFASVLSKKAEAVFTKHGVLYSCETSADAIINRAGTGPCPMENAVNGVDDPRKAYDSIIRTLDILRNEKRRI
ncbi:MAG: DUF1893 domain-containing protein [Firmicutes bacterium HGW-Firmicutes-16]|nr:MAG: DUF1893 domain-containing protein [Firmicutes bacterium HGW-Firmicutes-16]